MNKLKKEIKRLEKETILQKKLNRITYVSNSDELFFVEWWCDGFGHDTYIDSVFPTLQQAQDYVLKNFPNFDCVIVGGRFGEEIRQFFD